MPVGIICACMPAVRSLFSLVFPKFFSTTRKGSSYGFGSVGPSLKLSSQPKHSSNRKQISVKQEWTVVSTDVGHERFPSDEGLVRPPLDDDAELPPRRMALVKGGARSDDSEQV